MRIVFVICAMLSFSAFALPLVTKVAAKQRYPWNGLVDIAVTIQGAAEDLPNTACTFVATNSAIQAAIPVEHITQNGDDTGSGTTWTRKFVWDAKADVGAVKIDDVTLTVDVERSLGGVQLWENGPYWAECNVGATKPEEAGYYFWWGDTIGYKRNASNNGWISVKDSTSYSFNGCPTYGNNNSQLQSDGYIDSTGKLVAAHDAATAHLGAPWRMPTVAEFSALINNCDTEWTSRNGVSGRLFKGRGDYASKSIFLPAAGFGYDSHLNYPGSYGFWSSSPGSGGSDFAWSLHFTSSDFYRANDHRYYGESVRPVRGFASASGGGVASDNAVTTHFAYVPPADDVTRFEGGLYGIENSPQDCEDPHGDERYIEHMYSEEDYAGCWQKDYVEIDGRKEPAAFRDNRRFGFAIPVLVASGGTITPEIVHLTSNGTYFHQIEVLSDEEFRTWDRREDVSIPSPDPNRCWVIVLHNEQPNVKPDSNQRYRFDITKMSAANGKDMMEWAHEHGEEFPEAISLPESVSYAIRIKETGEVFPNRFWNVYNPMYDELYDAFDGADYEEEDYIEYPGLWLVTQEMIDEQKGAGVAEVTFDANGGTCATTSKSYESGATLGTLPTATRSGYTFDGWFTAASGGTQVTEATVVTENVTYYAHWVEDQPPVSYAYEDNGDGTVTLTGAEGVSGNLIIPGSIDGKLVTSIGGQAFEYCHGLTSVTIPEGVTNIGNYAFAWCGGLKSVTISSSVTSIGYGPFDYCWELSAIAVEAGNLKYSSCDGIVYDRTGSELVLCPAGRTGNVTIPSGVTCIRNEAFHSCEKLISVHLPSSVNRIEDNAFAGCDSMTEFAVDEGNAWYSSSDGILYNKAGTELIKYPDGKEVPPSIPAIVTRIGNWAFAWCKKLTEVTIPLNVTSIGESAFYGCGLTSVTIPSSVTSIGNYAFAWCGGLKSVTISEGVMDIGGAAFEACGMTSVTIPSSVTRIGDCAFEQCFRLTKVTIREGVTSIGSCAFAWCRELAEVVIPQSVTRIEVGAFDDTPFCANQPEGMTILGGGVLYQFKGTCPSSVTIPSSVTSIGDSVFSGCSELTSVTIPSNVTSVGSYAFSDCDHLKTVYVNAGDGCRIRGLLEEGALNSSQSDDFISTDMLEFVETDSAGGSIQIWDTYKFEYYDDYYEADLTKSFGIDIYDGSDLKEDLKKYNVSKECGSYALFEVYGAKSKDQIKPTLDKCNFNGNCTMTIWTDRELREKAMPDASTDGEWWGECCNWRDYRASDDVSGFILNSLGPRVFPDSSYDHRFGYHEFETDEAEWKWPCQLWPNGNTKDDRFWIAVKLDVNTTDTWYGMEKIRVAAGSSSTDFYVYRTPEDSPLPGRSLADIFRGITFDESSVDCYGMDCWESWSLGDDAYLNSWWIECGEDDCLY